MKSQQFIERLYAAGWKATSDAQHTHILELWKEIFPGSAELEKKLKDISEMSVNCIEDGEAMKEEARYAIEG